MVAASVTEVLKKLTKLVTPEIGVGDYQSRLLDDVLNHMADDYDTVVVDESPVYNPIFKNVFDTMPN